MAQIEPRAVLTPADHPVVPAVIAKVIVEIQKTLKPLVKTATNDEFDSGYVPLEVVAAKAYELLAKKGIAVMQPPTTNDQGLALLETILVHKSGVGFSRITRLVVDKATPQKHGASITYMRRYALMGMLGLVAENEDDDGNTASGIDVKATDEQREELAGMLRHLKFPKEDIAKEIWKARTRDQAALAIHNYRKIVSQRVADIEGAEAALEIESGKPSHIDVVDDSTPQATLMARIEALGLASKGHENKLIRRATGKPFISKVKTPDEVKALDEMVTMLEQGITSLPAEFYAPRGEPIVVNEDVA